MGHLLEKWKVPLVHRLQTNASAGIARADKLEDSFNNEYKPSLRKFLNEKYPLYSKMADMQGHISRLHILERYWSYL